MTALDTALAYHRAWTAKDLDGALRHIDPDIVCHAPAGRIDGLDGYRAFMAPFVAMLRGARLLGAFGDGDTALVMYDTETALVASAPGAELVTVRDGRIVESWFIFDRLPFAEARRSA